MKEYIELKTNESHKENYLVVTTGYELGGHSVLTGRTVTRGYYMYAYPVTREVRDDGRGGTYCTEAQELFRGNKYLLKEVTRQSKKAAAEAEAEAQKLRSWLIGRVCQECGLTLKTEVA